MLLAEDATAGGEPLQDIPGLLSAPRVALRDGDADQSDADQVPVDVSLERVAVDRTEEAVDSQLAASRFRRRSGLRDGRRRRVGGVPDRRGDQADREGDSE